MPSRAQRFTLGDVEPGPVEWAEKLVGTVVGRRYRLEGLLGAGGMGAVFEAQNAAVGRRVAIKVLLPFMLRRPEAVRRFSREARAAAQVAGHGVAEIYDLEVDEKVGPFIVMEYLVGEALFDRIDRAERLDVESTIQIAQELLLTLARVHEHGVVHRDLKPENVFLASSPGGEIVKILDFGLVRMLDARDTAELTKPGGILGTPAYMAPEQLRGSSDVDPRADLYSVAAIVFTCLTGCTPNPGDTFAELIKNVLSGTVIPLQQLRPELDDTLVAAVHQGLSLDPDDRFADADAMCRALVDATQGRGQTLRSFSAGASMDLSATQQDPEQSVDGLDDPTDRSAPWLPPTLEHDVSAVEASLDLSGERSTMAPGVPATREGTAVRPPPANQFRVLVYLVLAFGALLAFFGVGALLLVLLWPEPRPEPGPGSEARPELQTAPVAPSESVVSDGPSILPPPWDVAETYPRRTAPIQEEQRAARYVDAIERARALADANDHRAALDELDAILADVERNEVHLSSLSAQLVMEAGFLAGDLTAQRIGIVGESGRDAALASEWAYAEGEATRRYHISVARLDPTYRSCSSVKLVALSMHSLRALEGAVARGVIEDATISLSTQRRVKLGAARQTLESALQFGGPCAAEAQTLASRLPPR